MMDLDHSAIARYYEAAAGMEIRAAEEAE